MEQVAKKLKINLDTIRAKARKVQQMSKKWEHDLDEKKWLSFIPDSDSDGDIKIDVNKCFKCDITFKKKEKRFMGVTIVHDGTTRNASQQLFYVIEYIC